MSAAELATLIFMVCGRGYSERVLDCRDLMVNCSVGKDGKIEKKQVEICEKRVKAG